MDNRIILHLKITEPGADQEKILELNSNLIKSIRKTDIDLRIQESGKKTATIGTKGDAAILGMLVLAIAPALLPQFLQFLQGWLVDRRKISIEAPNGAKVEFVSGKKMTEEEIIDLVRDLNKIRSSKDSVKRKSKNGFQLKW